MLHKLLVIVCLICANYSFAQNATATPPNATGKTADTAIDYKVAGAPMPPLKVLKIEDTSKNKDTVKTTGTAAHQPPHKGKKQEKGENSPYITDKDLDNGANLFVMMFNPTCSHCMDETAVIEKNISLFNKSKWVLLANPVMKPYVPDFIKQMHVSDYQPFLIGIDSSDFLNKVYRYGALPQINVYDKDRNLIKIFNGEIEIDSLKQYIQ
jgi:hypothetical protein